LRRAVSSERKHESRSADEDRGRDRCTEQPGRECERRAADDGVQDRDHPEEDVARLLSRELQVEAADAVDRPSVEKILDRALHGSHEG
jgi:hypothetical protein